MSCVNESVGCVYVLVCKLVPLIVFALDVLIVC